MKKVLKDSLLITLIVLSTIGLIVFVVSLSVFFVGCSTNNRAQMEDSPVFMISGLISFVYFGVSYCAAKAFWLYIDEREKTTPTQFV